MRKIAFITGASSGFGASIAKRLDDDGYSVIICARRKQKLQELAKILKNPCLVLELDVRDKNAVFSAVNSLKDEWARIDILVNNAGLALGQEKTPNASLEDFEIMIDTNIKGLVYVTKALLGHLNKGAIIFNLGSVAGCWPYPGANVYGASKAFVHQFSLNLRNDLAGRDIRVSVVAPGIAKTEFSDVRFKGDHKRANAVYDGTKYLSADDIAQIVIDIAKLPEHVNINYVELMPVSQSWAGFSFWREDE